MEKWCSIRNALTKKKNGVTKCWTCTAFKVSWSIIINNILNTSVMWITFPYIYLIAKKNPEKTWEQRKRTLMTANMWIAAFTRIFNIKYYSTHTQTDREKNEAGNLAYLLLILSERVCVLVQLNNVQFKHR